MILQPTGESQDAAGDNGFVPLTSATVKAIARDLGFDLCGIAAAEPPPQLGHVEEWLRQGFHGEMEYLARNADRRRDVRRVLPSAQSVIVLGAVYNTDAPDSFARTAPGAALISRYAWGEDYHEVLSARLARLDSSIRERAGRGYESRYYVDTGPVVERAYAEQAGLGWIGKNTCLINSERGSWIFLCELICNLKLTPDSPASDRCGTCTLCIEACPTQALVSDHVLDATRCISYLTIELKGSIPDDLRRPLGQHVYGCDVCQEVCPWNGDAIASVSDDPAWRARAAFDGADLGSLWRTSDADLRTAMKGTPMTRARVKRFRRNLAVAMGNSADAATAAALDEPIDAPSIADPLIQEQVEWAKESIGKKKQQKKDERR